MRGRSRNRSCPGAGGPTSAAAVALGESANRPEKPRFRAGRRWDLGHARRGPPDSGLHRLRARPVSASPHSPGSSGRRMDRHPPGLFLPRACICAMAEKRIDRCSRRTTTMREPSGSRWAPCSPRSTVSLSSPGDRASSAQAVRLARRGGLAQEIAAPVVGQVVPDAKDAVGVVLGAVILDQGDRAVQAPVVGRTRLGRPAPATSDLIDPGPNPESSFSVLG